MRSARLSPSRLARLAPMLLMIEMLGGQRDGDESGIVQDPAKHHQLAGDPLIPG
jgi:hypothetical protein